MIVTDKFVFVHLPRSGGTFISEIIKRFFPSAQEIGYHLPRSALPAAYSHLPILGGVRNPWDFYASWYHHQYSGTRYLPLFCGLSNNRSLNFVETIQNALELGVDDEKLSHLIRNLPDSLDFETRHISNITKDTMWKIRNTGQGLYTFRFNQLFGEAEDVFFCRVESLRRDLITFFDKLSVTSHQLRSEVLRSEKKNTSNHVHYSNYYPAELAKLVAVRDRTLIKRFGYTFERPSFTHKHQSNIKPNFTNHESSSD